MITLVAAMDRRWVIGDGPKIPWNLPGDVKHFKAFTLGHAIVMGRATWDTVGKPLPKRTNVVLSRSKEFAPEGAVVVRTFDEALEASERAHPGGEVMVIGGAQVYALALPRADRVMLSVVQGVFAGDVRFPRFDPSSWSCASWARHPVNERDPHAWVLFDWRREGPATPDAQAAWAAAIDPV